MGSFQARMRSVSQTQTRVTGAIELVERSLEVARGPQDQDVEHEPERSELGLLALSVALAELPAVAVKEPPDQAVTGLLAVELNEDVTTVGGAVDELEQVERLGDTAEFGQGARQGRRCH